MKYNYGSRKANMCFNARLGQ